MVVATLDRASTESSAPPDSTAHLAVQPGQEVGIAVRPEKVKIHRDSAPQGRIALRGRVSEVAYYGDTSHVYLRLESGQTISANLQNEARTSTAAVSVEDDLWCSWDPRDTLVLQS